MRAFLYALPIALALVTSSLLASDDGVSNPKTTRTQSASPVVTSAEGVASAQDHQQRVELRGRIAGVIDKQEGTEYVLSDNTGSVVAKISDEALHGETLFIGTAVEMRGEVDSVSAIDPKVEARQLQILASVNGPPIQDQEIYSD
jgi:uncharacterized protein (TIGR00156 family)